MQEQTRQSLIEDREVVFNSWCKFLQTMNRKNHTENIIISAFYCSILTKLHRLIYF